MTARTIAPASTLHALVAGVVDYAGLFPPAALDMEEAVAGFAAYRTSPDAWMLGRFVVPVARIDRWVDAVNGYDPRDPHSLPRVEGWEAAEVAELLGISDGNQRVLLHRARSKVRAAVEAAA